MSTVTNVILIAQHDNEKSIAFINLWLAENTINGSQLKEIPYTAYAGTKNLETDLYIAAFNGLRVEEFIKVVRVAPWTDFESVQLFIMEQDDIIFKERLHNEH